MPLYNLYSILSEAQDRRDRMQVQQKHKLALCVLSQHKNSLVESGSHGECLFALSAFCKSLMSLGCNSFQMGIHTNNIKTPNRRVSHLLMAVLVCFCLHSLFERCLSKNPPAAALYFLFSNIIENNIITSNVSQYMSFRRLEGFLRLRMLPCWCFCVFRILHILCEMKTLPLFRLPI